MISKIVIISLVIIVIIGVVFLFISQSSNNLKSNLAQENTQELQNESDPPEGSRYLAYSKEAFESAKGLKRVYFFHAKWCPTCKTANSEILSRIDEIPEGVRLFKTDYDTQKELKNKYAVTYQHTYVYVDQNGNEVKKWNGGAIDELIANTN